MSIIKRLEQLEKRPEVQTAERRVHAQHLSEMLVKGKLDVRECTDDELELLISLLCEDEEEVKRMDAELRQLTDEELQAFIGSHERQPATM